MELFGLCADRTLALMATRARPSTHVTCAALQGVARGVQRAHVPTGARTGRGHQHGLASSPRPTSYEQIPVAMWRRAAHRTNLLDPFPEKRPNRRLISQSVGQLHFAPPAVFRGPTSGLRRGRQDSW